MHGRSICPSRYVHHLLEGERRIDESEGHHFERESAKPRQERRVLLHRLVHRDLPVPLEEVEGVEDMAALELVENLLDVRYWPIAGLDVLTKDTIVHAKLGLSILLALDPHGK